MPAPSMAGPIPVADSGNLANSVSTGKRPRAAQGRGGRWIVLGTTLAGALAGAALWIAWPKTYVATSEMLIDPNALRPAAVAAAPLAPDAAFAMVDNQLRVLRSGPTLAAVAERLNLAADPEFNGADTGPFGLGGAMAGLGELVAGDGASAVERRRRQVVEALDRALRVERIGGSSVVAVSAVTGDPRKSALIANTISEQFLSGAGGSDGTPERLRAAAAEAERAVAAFRQKNGLVDAQGRSIGDEEVARLEEELAAARAHSAELGTQAASVRVSDVDAIVTGSVPERYASDSLTDLRNRHADLKQQVDRMSARLGPRHPELLAAEAELAGARRAIDGELRRASSALQTDLQFAVRQEQELAAQVAQLKTRREGLGEQLAALNELERDAERKRAAYERSLDMAQNGAGPSADGISVISRAEPPLRGQGPSLPAFTLAGAAAGFLAGIGFLGLRRGDGDGDEDEFSAGPGTPGSDGSEEWDDPQDRPEEAPFAAHPDAPYGIDDFQEAQDMYPPYPPHYSQPPAAAPAQPASHGYERVAPMPVQIPVQNAPAWPAWPAQQQMLAPPPHDPWAHLRGYAPAPYHAAAPAYYYPPAVHPAAHPAQPHQVQPYQGQPYPQQPVESGHRLHSDPHTDAAIEEIRWNLRELRAAIEEFAGSRAPRRRSGA